MSIDLISSLIKAVVVTNNIAHSHHTLNNRVLEFNEYSPLGHTRYMAVKLLTDLIGHKLHHLIFYRCALRIGCNNLTL